MRKLMTLAAAVLAVGSAFAQKGEPKVGVHGGLNIAKSDVSFVSTDAKVGFNLGVDYQYPIYNSLYVKTGLDFSTLGHKFKAGGIEETFNPMYLQVPVTAAYHFELTNGVTLEADGGGYFGFGVGGKETVEDGGLKVKEKIFSAEDGETMCKRFDAGLRLGIALNIDSYVLGVNYTHGLTNVFKDADDGGELKNRAVSLSVGYRF